MPLPVRLQGGIVRRAHSATYVLNPRRPSTDEQDATDVRNTYAGEAHVEGNVAITGLGIGD